MVIVQQMAPEKGSKMTKMQCRVLAVSCGPPLSGENPWESATSLAQACSCRGHEGVMSQQIKKWYDTAPQPEMYQDTVHWGGGGEAI